MAVITSTRDMPVGDRSIVRIAWGPMANSDTGIPAQLPVWSDRTVQVNGTFGAGGTLKIRGSNDGTNYYDLTDPQGAAISFTAAGIKLCTEVPLLLRPEVTGGDGTTALTVTLVMRTNTAIVFKS